MKCVNNLCNRNSRSEGKKSKGLCRVCQNRKQNVLYNTNNELNQEDNYIQLQPNIPSKRGRPLKNDNYCTSTVNRKFIKDREIVNNFLLNSKFEGIVQKISIVLRYAGIDKEYSFPLEDDEDEEEGDDLNTCIRLAHWKLNWSISNDAINQILGKDYINYKIKSHSLLSLLSRIKEWMKMKIPFKEYSITLNNRLVQVVVVNIDSLLQYLLTYKYIGISMDVINVLISGDARVNTKKTQITLFTLKILHKEINFNITDNVFTIGLVDEGEKKEILEILWNHINSQLEDICANNITYQHNNQVRKISVNFFLCSDLKFLSLCLGINAANSNFACPFCTCCKNDRKLFGIEFDSTFHREFSTINGKCRCRDDGNCNSNHGVKHNNLLSKSSFSFDRIFVDTLHILLRITDIMEDGLIKDALDTNNIQNLILVLKEQCGVSWNHYFHKDTNELMFRQLNGNEKKKILENLRDLSTVMEVNTDTDPSNNIWIKMFGITKDIFNYLDCSKSIHDRCFHVIKDLSSYKMNVIKLKEMWIMKMGESSITPYFHILEYHVPKMILNSPFSSIAQFNLSSNEQKHATQKMIQQRNTNHQLISQIIEIEHSQLWFIDKLNNNNKRKRKKTKIIYEHLFSITSPTIASDLSIMTE